MRETGVVDCAPQQFAVGAVHVHSGGDKRVAKADVIRDTALTLVSLLQQGIPSGMVDPTRITVATPDEFVALKDPAHPNVTIFLYRIAVNAAMRNANRRNIGNGKTTRPLLPLELSFLITPWAKETRDELRIAGRILQTLYDHAELGAADLAGSSWEQDDTVQLVLDSLPLEDQYRIWDAGEVPYRLSLTYTARVVGIAPAEELALPPVIQAQIGGNA